MVLKDLDDSMLEELLGMFSPKFIQEESELLQSISFEPINNDVVFDYDFYISDLKLGELSVVANGSLKIRSFQPLKEKPFLKRTGSDSFFSKKKHSYSFGLLAQAKMCSLLVDSYGSKKVEYSEPIPDLALKFYKGIGIDVNAKPPMKFKDYSNKIFEEANKRGFEF